MVVDFHSHILPRIDDGAESSAMALEMIRKSKDDGVEAIVSTSHCYPYEESDVDKFLHNRRGAYKRLKAVAEREGVLLPEIYLGSEVHLTCDITKLKNISSLCIEDTRYMLLEMPYSVWKPDVIDIVYKLCAAGIKPIIAHAERNMGQSFQLQTNLYNLDVLVQINAESFSGGRYVKFIDTMLKNKMVHLIGSDMHNMTTRRPNFDIAYNKIKKRYGLECWEYIMDNAASVISGKDLTYKDFKSFKKKGIFGI